MNYKTENNILVNITEDIFGVFKVWNKSRTYSRILDSSESLR